MHIITFPENYIKPPFPGRDKYTAALRSGAYPQITGRLCNSSGYCCLGVISEIQGRLTNSNGLYTDGVGGSNGDLSSNNPLCSVFQECGHFPEGVLVESYGEKAIHLVGCNDNLGLTFLEIADIIEQIWDHMDA